MKAPKLILPLLILLLTNCSKNKNLEEAPISRDSANIYFSEGKLAEEIPKKMALFNKALLEIGTKKDTLKPVLWDYKIYYHQQLKEYDSALFYAEKLIAYGLEHNDTLQAAKGYYRKSRSYHYLNNQIEVLKNLYRSQQFYLAKGDSISAGKRLVELGIAQKRLGDFAGSQESQVKALELLKNTTDATYFLSIYNNLATSYRQLNDLEEAIDEYEIALSYARTRKDSLTVLNNIANAYTDLEEYTEALEIFKGILPKTSNNEFGFRIKDNYYFTQWLNGTTAYKDSLELVLGKRLEAEDRAGLLASYDHLSQVNRQNAPRQSLEYAEKYYEQAQQINSPTDKVRALKYMIALAPPNEAKGYSLSFIKLEDSLTDALGNAKNIFAKIKYDEEQKLAQINELQRIAALQEIALLKSSNQRNLAFFIIILLAGIGGFLYYYFRQQAKKKRIRVIHHTEARISRRIHDELANDLYKVMIQLENLKSVKLNDSLDKLERLYMRTRDISRENLPVKTNNNYQHQMQDMLSQMVPGVTKLYLIGIRDVEWNKLTGEAKIELYRVLQELMVNMKKHSEATIVSLKFKNLKNKLQINYNDNGVGVGAEGITKGEGLANVENRMETIGGSFKFKSENHGGFSAELTIPV